MSIYYSLEELPKDDVIDWLLQSFATAMEKGQTAHACSRIVAVGDRLVELGDQRAAESVYRQGVALARQSGSEDPNDVYHAFESLISFLEPSDESVALAEELYQLLERPDMQHPMRSAETAYLRASVTLKLACINRSKLQDALTAARVGIETCDDVCFHQDARRLELQVIDALLHHGLDYEASNWRIALRTQEEGAKDYRGWKKVIEGDEDWYEQIPGHVHLWDIRVEMPSFIDE